MFNRKLHSSNKLFNIQDNFKNENDIPNKMFKLTSIIVKHVSVLKEILYLLHL